MDMPLAKTLRKDPATGRLSSVTSALLVLKVFSEDEAEIGISSLAKRLGLAKSTVHRLAVTLAAEGFLEQNPENGRYRLGLALFSLGALVRQRMDVSNAGPALLGALRDKTHEGVHLAILAQTSIMYLYNLETSQAIGIRSDIGTRKPAFCTCEGRAMLAFGTTEMLDAVIEEGLVAAHPAAPTPTPRRCAARSRKCASRATRSTTRRARSGCAASARRSATSPARWWRRSAWPARSSA